MDNLHPAMTAALAPFAPPAEAQLDPAQVAEEAAIAAIDALVEVSPERAMSILAAHFVGLMAAVVDSRGGDPDEQIKIEGGEARDITIHARKKGRAA